MMGLEHHLRLLKPGFNTAHDETIKPFILLVVDKREEGLKAANNLLQKRMLIQLLLVVTLTLVKICYMANIYLMRQVPYIIEKVLLHNLCLKMTKVT